MSSILRILGLRKFRAHYCSFNLLKGTFYKQNSIAKKDLHSWCKEAAGDDYEIKWIQRFKNKNLTSVEPGYKWWDAFSGVMDGLNAKLIKTIFPGKLRLQDNYKFPNFETF